MGISASSGATALNGPWRFSLGDDPSRRRPDYDDSRWETVDLTPRLRAHDADVGLVGYVPGWAAHGHAGRSGFGWYRLQVDLGTTPRTLVLAAPTLVDSAYEIFWDGHRIGGLGDFSRTPPIAYGIRPRAFPLDGALAGRHEIAVRTWMDPAEAGAPDAGGLHVAPSLGDATAVAALLQRERAATFKGYVVDAAEPLAFLVLAIWALSRRRPDETGSKSAWLALALILTALLRANQPLFFWTSWESLHAYDALRNVVETPAVLTVWMLALRAWLSPPRSGAIGRVAIVLGVSLAIAQLLGRSWVDPAGLAAVKPLAHAVAADLRLAFVAVFAWLLGLSLVTWRGSARSGPALVSALLVGVGLFAEELSQLHLKGVWFPFGVGVSRTQFAYAAAVLTLTAMIALDQAGPRRPAGLVQQRRTPP